MTTKADAINGAMSIAEDIASGKLTPAQLEMQAVSELKELAGTVIGPDDPLFELQCEIARGVLAAGGGLSADELSEWLAVARSREAAGSGGTDTPAESVSPVSVAHSPQNDGTGTDPEEPGS